MTLAHLVYIPVVMLCGLAIGFVLGARAVRSELEKQARRARR